MHAHMVRSYMWSASHRDWHVAGTQVHTQDLFTEPSKATSVTDRADLRSEGCPTQLVFLQHTQMRL